ncbi:MAG: polymer-forming cytoskeletal protein [Bacteroidetes bacterium]|nr:MAG: polymer-forming cytoskeletal protein [Bacteroidota bacterium]PTM10296.1 MAG: polymer-forming cytoskeletal protein [Bacteroidota bacterium]
MFNSNVKKETSNGKSPATPASSGGHSLNSIVQGTEVEGTVQANSDIRVDGTIKGKLFCEAKVIIGPTGKVTGEIRCQNAVIEGSFEGTISVKELLNIRETATVEGDVTYGKLIVQPGGTIDGTIAMGGAKKLVGTASNKFADKSAKVASQTTE